MQASLAGWQDRPVKGDCTEKREDSNVSFENCSSTFFSTHVLLSVRSMRDGNLLGDEEK